MGVRPQSTDSNGKAGGTMLEFYKLLNVQTDAEMAECLRIGVQELEALRQTGKTPWELLVPALLDAGIGVDVCIGNMTVARAQYPDKSAAAPLRRILARVDYNQMLALRRMQLI